MKKIFSLLFLGIILIVLPCINVHRTLLDGTVVQKNPVSGKIHVQEIDTTELRKKADQFLFNYEISDSISYYSDYAAALIYLNDLAQAEKVLIEIERKNPKQYATASNLGTLYELKGQNQKAYDWIRKSMALNPNSHEGSEWIHLKILEYKLKDSVDISTSILGLDFGTENIPANPKQYALDTLQNQLRIQLQERLHFIKPPNTIMGNLYFDYGNILAQTDDIESALQSYQEAERFGFESELMTQRIKHFEDVSKKVLYEKELDAQLENIQSKMNYFLWVFLIFLGLIALYFSLRKKKRRRL